MRSINQLSTNEISNQKTKSEMPKKKKEEKLFVFDENNTISKEDIFSHSSKTKSKKVKTITSTRRKRKNKVKAIFHYSKLKYQYDLLNLLLQFT